MVEGMIPNDGFVNITVAELEAIIAVLKEKGIEVVSLGEIAEMNKPKEATQEA